MSSLLQREIRQQKPFASPAEEAFLNLQRTAAALMASLARLLREHGLTPAQYNALRILRGARPDSLPCGEVGTRMVTPVPDVTRLLDRLELRGLVARARDRRDRRVVQARITDAGLELLAEAEEPLDAWLAAKLGRLGDGNLATLTRLLEEAREKS